MKEQDPRPELWSVLGDRGLEQTHGWTSFYTSSPWCGPPGGPHLNTRRSSFPRNEGSNFPLVPMPWGEGDQSTLLDQNKQTGSRYMPYMCTSRFYGIYNVYVHVHTHMEAIYIYTYYTVWERISRDGQGVRFIYLLFAKQQKWLTSTKHSAATYASAVHLVNKTKLCRQLIKNN